jgi:hypothetical protein
MENAYRIIHIGNIITNPDTGYNGRIADNVLAV